MSEFRRRQTVLEELLIPLPCPADVLAGAMTEIAKDVTLNEIRVTPGSTSDNAANGPCIVLSYTRQHDTAPALLAPPVDVTAPPAPLPAPTPTPAPAPPQPPATGPESTPEAPAPDPTPGVVATAEQNGVVPPFPTHPKGDLPELTVEAAREVVKHAGTFYFHLAANASNANVQMYRMRPKSAAKIRTRETGREHLVEVRRMKAQQAIAVTVVTDE